MIRLAVPEDAPAIEAFLYKHAETSMFLLNNLLSYGIDHSTHHHATTFWIEGDIDAVFGIAGNGFAVAQAPDAGPESWAAWAREMQGRHLRGMTGVPAQVDAAFAALGLQEATFLVNKDDPLYVLMQRDVPKWEVEMRLALPEDEQILRDWFKGYAMDTGLTASEQEATAEGTRRAADAIGNADVMLLIEGGMPAAMAGINARLPHMVQVGGVFTPRYARGRGLARRAVVGLLQAQSDVERSVLFAADAAAARAYQAIGYRLVGLYRVAMLEKVCVVGAP